MSQGWHFGKRAVKALFSEAVFFGFTGNQEQCIVANYTICLRLIRKGKAGNGCTPAAARRPGGLIAGYMGISIQ
jgi:hypothetical protein